jgi:hypothetical protein
MNLVYFSHSYRKEDVVSVNFFGRLMRSEGLVPSLDPPSESVNAAKLERHLRSSDGMIAVLNWREGGLSQHILFEIALCLRSRKPLLVFVEDVLPDDTVPFRILQRRFSRRSFLRQIREHRHALKILKTYLGEHPPPKYQPTPTKRSCLLTGVADLPKGAREFIRAFIEERGYSVVDLDELTPFLFQALEIYEAIASADLALCCVDARTSQAQYLQGAIQAAFIPTIAITTNASYSFHPKIPREYQPQFINMANTELIRHTLETQLELYEEDFIELDNQEEVATYASLLVDFASLRGKYEEETRNVFIRRLVMGDEYTVGQAGVVGPGGHAHDMTFNQIWNQAGSDIDLSVLASELSELRARLKEEAMDPDHDIAVGEVASAERAAREGDGPTVLEHLAKAGQWALDVATRIGVPVAVAALKTALGL